MCNNTFTGQVAIKLKAIDIPVEGIGYKLFSKKNKSLIGEDSYYYDNDGWITWRKRDDFFYQVYPPCFSNKGFTFFLTEKETKRALISWHQLQILLTHKNPQIMVSGCINVSKIKYRGGLQERDEKNFIRNHCFRVALCKSFKIMEG